jgi:hypothetical protein
MGGSAGLEPVAAIGPDANAGLAGTDAEPSS